jgi:tripartite-type tricarboxylate transporter receptor subunit TctC
VQLYTGSILLLVISMNEAWHQTERKTVNRLRKIERTLTLCLAALVATAMVVPVAAQGLSNRPITIIVPYSPGTGPDVMARTVGEELQKRWNEPVVIDNRPGATGNIGTQMVARATPDGHTLLMTSNPFTTNVSLFSHLPYDPIKSFVPIIDVGAGALALCVHPGVPVTSVKEFVDYANLHHGELNYGSPGVGGPHHLAMELFKQITKIDIKHVPYRGSAGATQDIVGGHVADFSHSALRRRWREMARCAFSAWPARSACARLPTCRRSPNRA